MNLPKEILIEHCCHCGKDVSRGSGAFVNRVPDLNNIFTRLANNRPYPTGDFVCEACDRGSGDNEPFYED